MEEIFNQIRNRIYHISKFNDKKFVIITCDTIKEKDCYILNPEIRIVDELTIVEDKKHENYLVNRQGNERYPFYNNIYTKNLRIYFNDNGVEVNGIYIPFIPFEYSKTHLLDKIEELEKEVKKLKQLKGEIFQDVMDMLQAKDEEFGNK